VHRAAGIQRFSEEDKCMMSLLVPHLQRAFHISRYIQTIKGQNESATNVIDQLSFGVVLVDGYGKPVTANRKARMLNKHSAGLSITSSGIYVASSRDTQALQQVIKDACGKVRKGGVLALERPLSQLPLTLIVTPLNPELSPLGAEADKCMAAIFIYDPEEKRNICIETLRKIYGLTKAEAKLAKALAEGFSIDEIASQTSVSKHTLRTQLKVVFRKTGLNRQSDIIRLILGGPG
jgi:DNA-binding CsgD family transcriptional regulator